MDEIQSKLLTKTNKINTAIIRREWFKESDLNKQILNETKFLSASASYSERIFCVKNNIKQLQLCPFSGVPLRFNPVTHQYAKVSGCENAQKVVNLEERGKKASISKQNNNKEVRDKIRCSFYNKSYTLIDRAKILEFVDQRLLESDYGKKTQFITEKHKKNNLDILCSLLEYTHSPLLEPIPERINWSERFYLLKNNIAPPTLYDDPNKIATYENYQLGYRRTKINERRHNLIDKVLPNTLKDQGFKLLNESVLNLKHTVFKLECEKCGKILEKELTNARWKDVYCSGCFRDIGFSKLEREVGRFLTENNITFEHNKKAIINSGELDIYIPSKNIAIEFNGILWHSFGTTFPNNYQLESVNKFKHNDKTNECAEQNIQLLHIWDAEWNRKQEIVKSIILSKLGIYKNRIFARKCKIQSINTEAKKAFIDSHHIQGDCNSTYNYGLFYNAELVSVMTFGSRKITGSGPNVELLRFCNKLNTQVIGGASKLFSHFIVQVSPAHIISYADRRYSNGTFYSKIGFSLSHVSQPNYWYTDNAVNLYHRMNFQKHKISTADTDKGKTESEIMFNRGFRRIYDCGNYVFEYSATK